MKSILTTAVLLSLSICSRSMASPVVVTTEWVKPVVGKRTFDTPQNRTRPIVVGDIVYSADLHGNVFAVHRTEGYILWKAKVPGRVDGALAYGRSKVFVGDLQGNLVALNARDGSENWRFKIQTEWLAAPLVYRDKVFAATSNDEIYALSETRGKEIWHYANRGDEKMTIRGTSSPAIHGDLLYQGFSNGTVAALATDSGKVRWLKTLRTRPRFYDVDTTPFIDTVGVIAGTYDGKLYGLDKNSGAIQWTFPAGAYAAPLVEDGRIFVSGLDGNLYALDRETSAVVWKTPYRTGVALSATRAGDELVFTTSGDPVIVVDMKTGKILTEVSLGNGTMASATGTPDGWFYVNSNYGNLISFRIRDIFPRKGPQTLVVPSAVTRDFVEKESNRKPS